MKSSVAAAPAVLRPVLEAVATSTEPITPLKSISALLEEIDANMQLFHTKATIIIAIMQDTRTLSKNFRLLASQPLSPIAQTVVGSGIELAIPLAPHGIEPPSDLSVTPLVGDMPFLFNPDPSTYNHGEILDLVVFYNEDFGNNYQ
ncbi:hypothetical protein DFH08DRAFT_1071392 [Mycena albidolilacea]|uniref:Uncharacterized protein n=1 Tax=Mycena albidolilacea TaxID=1033008 RepID=A0AAD7AVF7_9AGAR|nr:hypothetical protein DFH08DRAFT_1071392 [Mycena albidolilacea]